MFNLNYLRVFVQAVDHGGFAAAARKLGIPKSTFSKRVAELEADLGARLVHRTSRSFALTDLGREFLAHARAAVIEAEAAESVVRRRQAEPSGVVRITASVPTAQFQLAACMPELVCAYPRLELQLHVSDRFVDLDQESYDLAIRSHFAPLPDSGLIQRPMSVERMLLVASPGYLLRAGLPELPPNLASHDGLLANATSRSWHLRDSAGEEVQVAPRVCMIADESAVLLEAARAGLGLACLPEAVIRDHVARGDLQIVLPAWSAGTVTTTILTPDRRYRLPAVRAVIDFLTNSSETQLRRPPA